MSWSRIDDGFALHPKVIAAGNAAVGCWLRCLVMCSAGKTDGFVPDVLARSMGTPKEIATLTRVGLWQRVGAGDEASVTGRKDTARRRLQDVTVTMPSAGYWIPDYLHFHRARIEHGTDDEVDAQRRAHSTVRTTQSAHGTGRAEHARRLVPVPSRPIQSEVPPSLPPSTSRTVPAPLDARPYEGGREVDPAEPGPEPGPEPDFDLMDKTPAELLDEVLVCLDWHTRQPKAERVALCTGLLRDGLDMMAALDLHRLAKREGDEPAALFAHWIDSGQWRGVLADAGLRTKEANVKARAPARDVDVPGPIYGEDPKPKRLRT